MNAVWEVAQVVLAVIGIFTVAAFFTFLWVVATDDMRDEWDGSNHPLDDGTWTAGDTEFVNEAARFKRGEDA